MEQMDRVPVLIVHVFNPIRLNFQFVVYLPDGW
jgi:hypothetical protein